MALISCIIPVYNGSAYIAAAIDSVLNQSMPVDELIVVDDGSEDSSPQILQQYSGKLRYIRKDHSGIIQTLNEGLRAANGDFITFLDADDLWHIDKTKLQFNSLSDHSEVDICFCHIQEFVSPELPEHVKSQLSFREEPLRGVGKTSAMFRKRCFDTIGFFSPDVQMGDFLEWYGRAMDEGIRSDMLDEVLTYRRVHLHNFTRKQRPLIQNYTHILKKSLDRKRMNS